MIKKSLKVSIPFILSVVFFFNANTCLGQIDYGFSWYLIKDDNSFKSRNEYNELINTASLYVAKSFSMKNKYFQALYSADMSNFNKYSGQNNYSHNFGVFSRIIADNYKFDIGGTVRLRRNDEQYILYNNDKYNFYFRMDYEPDLKSGYSAGLTYSRDIFREFEDLNNYAYRFFGKYQKFFQNRISLSGEIGLGVKNYMNQSVYNYWGAGRKNKFTEDPVVARQLSGSVNLGKSISDKTGISAKFGASIFIGDAIEAFSDGIYYYTENDLYDDPYSFEDRFVALTLTRQFSVGFQGKIGSEYHLKDYSGTPAITEHGDLAGYMREDTRNEYFFQVSKKFKPAIKFPGTLDVYFRFLIRQNFSNDPYYKFTDHLGVIGFKIGK